MIKLTTPIIILTITLVVLVLTNQAVIDSIAIFLVAGVIPLTNIVVPPSVMLESIAIIGGFAIARLIVPRLRILIRQPS